MAKRSRTPPQELDDIELLNIHRYPEGAPPGLLAQVRASKVYQKRLEELLKQAPQRRAGRASRPIAPAPVVTEEGAPAETPSLWDRFRRVLFP